MAGALLDAVDVSPGVRLLGVSVSGLVDTDTTARQLSFDDQDEPVVPGSRATARPVPPGRGTAPGPAPRRGPARRAGAAGAAGQATRSLAWHEVEAAVSAIRARYGNASVGPAALVGRDGLAVKERGDTQWGPSAPAPTGGPTGERRRRSGDVSGGPTAGPVPARAPGPRPAAGAAARSTAENARRRCLALRAVPKID